MTAAVLTIAEVASLYRCHPATVRRSIARGELPTVRLMGVTRVPVSALPATLALAYGSTAAAADASPGSAAGVEAPATGAVEPHGNTALHGAAPGCSTAPTSGAAGPSSELEGGWTPAAPEPQGGS